MQIILYIFSTLFISSFIYIVGVIFNIVDFKELNKLFEDMNALESALS